MRVLDAHTVSLMKLFRNSLTLCFSVLDSWIGLVVFMIDFMLLSLLVM